MSKRLFGLLALSAVALWVATAASQGPPRGGKKGPPVILPFKLRLRTGRIRPVSATLSTTADGRIDVDVVNSTERQRRISGRPDDGGIDVDVAAARTAGSGCSTAPGRARSAGACAG